MVSIRFRVRDRVKVRIRVGMVKILFPLSIHLSQT